jgi:hypothetical protein
MALTDQRLASLATAYLARVSDQQWRDTEELRHEATHRRYRHGIYGTTRQPPEPWPLAYPQQIDIAHKSWGMQPLDQLTERVSELGGLLDVNSLRNPRRRRRRPDRIHPGR